MPARIGFGTPGVLDPILQTMKNCNSTSLNGKPLQKDLEKLLGFPVTLANDANCFALAETHWGVVKEKFTEASVVFGIIMGTGVGGGIVLNGRIWPGKHGIAGEWTLLMNRAEPVIAEKRAALKRYFRDRGCNGFISN
jgi:predicted NBD/HSP70 family sugar kinase